MHGQVDGIGAQQRQPEVRLAQRLVEHAPGDLGEPVVDRGEHHQHRGNAHDHVEVRNHEIGIGERQVHRDVAQEQPGQAAVDEGEDEPDRKQHGHPEVDVAPPQGQDPVVDLQGRGHRDDQGGGGEEEPEVRVHAADVHVVGPDHEAERADQHDRPDHHPVAEDVLAGMHAQHVGDDPEGGQRDDVDLRMPEEPEQVLEQDGAAAAVVQFPAQGQHLGHEETGPDDPVERHHDRRHQQRRKRQQAQDGGHEDAPHRQRHAHQGHAAGPRLQHRGDVVQPAHGERDDEDGQRHQHQHDAAAYSRSALADRLGRIQRPAGAGGPAGDEETGQQHDDAQQVDPEAEHVHVGEDHVPGAAHQRDQVVAESTQEQRRQQVDDHDHPVHGHVLVILVGVHQVEAVGKTQLQAEQQRQHQRHHADENGGYRVLDRDHLVILAPDVLGDEGVGVVKVVIAVGDRNVCHQLVPPLNVFR